MPKKVLIVDDNAINRGLLASTLCAEYDVIETGNGVEALAAMRQNADTLAAVLLDIVMPVLDGYGVLESARDDVRLAEIPIVIVTGSEDESSRVKALSLGANDFIVKPYHAEIILHCLKNNIALRENATSLRALQRDKLTGLLNREAFFDRVATAVSEKEPGYYLLSCFDIDNFKLINDQFGAVEGDRILREIGCVVKEDMDSVGGFAGRVSGDNFATLFPAYAKDLSITRVIRQNRMAFSDKQAIAFSVGRYLVTDPTLPASAIYDRAYIAKQSVKGRYDEHIAYFDEAMLEKLVRDQQIIADMDIAIAEHQFEVWFQPQYNHSTKSLIGAEALVRWRHPVKGLIPPNDFIPVFEQNGFVYALDRFVWEDVCRYLRKWLDEGRAPLPVSVNISRYDIFCSDIVDVITGLVEQYGLPAELLRLEITESAFSSSTQKIVEIVKALIARGFTVEIDDFGSGYSSLNTLKDVPAQILKLDMRFLESTADSQRGGNIVESIVRMARWLGMAVIAEGVEAEAQADYLRSIGCHYIQGYYYAKPMPAEQYERLRAAEESEPQLVHLQTVDTWNNSAFWNPTSIESLIFNSYVGGACIFEFHNEKSELLRANGQYALELGSLIQPGAELMDSSMARFLRGEDRKNLVAAVHTAIDTHREATAEVRLTDGIRTEYVRATVRMIARTGERYLLYCVIVNVTQQRMVEEKERENAMKMDELLNAIPGGIVIYRVGASIETLYSSAGVAKLTGISEEEYADWQSSDIIGSAIYEDDAAAVRKHILTCVASGSPINLTFRLNHKNGSPVWVAFSASMIREESGGKIYYGVFTKPAAESALYQSLLEASPTAAVILEKRTRKILYANPAWRKIEGVPDGTAVIGMPVLDTIPGGHTHFSAEELEDIPQDRFCAKRAVSNAGRQVTVQARSLMWNGVPAYVCYLTDETELWNSHKKLQHLIDCVPVGIGICEVRGDELLLHYINDAYYRMLGFERDQRTDYLGANVLGAILPEDHAMIAESLREIREGKDRMDVAYRTLNSHNKQTWVRIQASVIERNGDGITVYCALTDFEGAMARRARPAAPAPVS